MPNILVSRVVLLERFHCRYNYIGSLLMPNILVSRVVLLERFHCRYNYIGIISVIISLVDYCSLVHH